MAEERKVILEMLRDGDISVEEAQRLMDAVPEDTRQSTENTALELHKQPEGQTPKRILIKVTEGGKSKVNVKVPFSLVRVGLKLGQAAGAMSGKLSPENAAALEMLKTIDIDEIMSALSEGDITLPYALVDVDDESKGEHVQIVLE
ncbi:hypothetical protein U6B65_07285 [Oscillospiraceae bacterium MB08-C2-2]|nr:hypothetical protein U6B65_07285 [Oscillospiraceae bacterium MB08-C2-2]